MGKQAERSQNEYVDREIAESFPASDPPSWTLGAAPATPTPPTGTFSAPAPRAALGVRTSGLDPAEGPSPAELFSRAPALDRTLVWGGGVAAAASVVLTAVGEDRLGRALGHGGIALLLIGIWRRLDADRAG